jgi:GT2 family glycosyltransferase
MTHRLRDRRPVSLSAKVSIGMAAHGNSSTTGKALQALFASASGNYELILIDDLSPDDTLEVYVEARKWHSNTQIFAFRENLEYCQSVNAFLSHARGDVLIFLSNDIFVCPAYLRQLVQKAHQHPECGILHGCSNFVDGESPVHNIPVPRFGSQEEYFAFAADLAYRRRKDSLTEERFLVGDAFLVTRALIEKIGTFDTDFFGYYGDGDFGLRAQIAGFRNAFVPGALALHERHANLDYLPADERARKLSRRHERVAGALSHFVAKYGLQLTEASVHDIPWEALAKRAFDPARDYVAPKDYSRYLLRD